jgi:hypothetical protein
MALKLRRGSDAERQTITPDEGELIYTIDTKELYIGDGLTLGGNLVSANLSDDTAPTLTSNLDLNGNDITGTGNINIDGTITATGNINLGDGAEDNVIVGGQIGSSLIPRSNNAYDLGAVSTSWDNVYARNVVAEGAVIDGELNTGSIVTAGNIVKPDSTVIYDGATDTLSVSNIVGNVLGSVFGDDSTPLVDGVNNKLFGDLENTNTTTSVLTADSVLVNSSVAGVTIETEYSSDDEADVFTINSAHNDVVSSAATFVRSRGTLDSTSGVNAGDELFTFVFVGASANATPTPSSFMVASVDDNGTVTNDVVPGKLSFYTLTGPTAEDFTTALTLDKDGLIGVAGNTLTAGVNPGQVDDSAAVSYLKINVGGTDYAMPLFAINP